MKRSDGELADALREAGSLRGAQRLLGLSWGPDLLARLKRVASEYQVPPFAPVIEGFAIRETSTTVGPHGTERQTIKAGPDSTVHPLVAPCGEGFVPRGISTLLGADGKIRAQWVKTREEDRAAQQWLDALPALLKPLRGSVKPAKAPPTDNDNLVGHILGDAHIGMLAWAPVSGTNWDLKIAEGALCAAADRLIYGAPMSRECLIVDVGDYQHADTPDAVTPRGKHQLDVEGRDLKVRQAALRIKRYYIDQALRHHEIVHVINVPGNHDPYASSWLSLALEALYEREPRAVINTSSAPHQMHRHGLTMIGVTHKPKLAEDLGHLMAAQWPEDWGASKYRYWLTGHVHHKSRIEKPGFKIESFGILAPGDRWAVTEGYLATRQMESIVWSPKYGEVGRRTITAAELGL